MKLNKCPKCNIYTLKEECKCGSKTKPAHYKFIKIKEESSRKPELLN